MQIVIGDFGPTLAKSTTSGMLVGITHENLKFMRTNFGRNFIHDSEKGANTIFCWCQYLDLC